MLKYLATKEKGFTLMELLIAVAIVAVLAGVGIPIYMKLQGGAKATEAYANLDGIRTSQEAYKMVHNVYIAAVQYPTAAPDATPDPWDPADAPPGFDDIGFQTNSDVRFVYAVDVDAATEGTDYTAGALGDTDGDAIYVLYIATQAQGVQQTIVEADGPTWVDPAPGMTLNMTD